MVEPDIIWALSERGVWGCRSEQQYLPSVSGGVIFGLGRCVAECAGVCGGVVLARRAEMCEKMRDAVGACLEMACALHG